MIRILAVVGAVWVLSLFAVILGVIAVIMQHDHEVAGCPDPDVCPGCDGYLEFDDDGSNICPACGSTWWWR